MAERRVVIGTVIVAAAVAAIAWWLLHGSGAAPTTAASRTADAAAATAGPGPTPAAPPAVGDAAVAAEPPRFRPLPPLARQAMLARLAARKAGQPPPADAPLPPPLPGAVDVNTVVDAVMPLIPALQDCYTEVLERRAAPRVAVGFDLTLEGDADTGTVITDLALTGDATFDAEPEFATCLRETLLAVELPPMVNGTKARFTTRLEFADEPDAEAPAPDAGPR